MAACVDSVIVMRVAKHACMRSGRFAGKQLSMPLRALLKAGVSTALAILNQHMQLQRQLFCTKLSAMQLNRTRAPLKLHRNTMNTLQQSEILLRYSSRGYGCAASG